MKIWYQWFMVVVRTGALTATLALLAPDGALWMDGLMQSNTIYVDADAMGVNDGTSWEDAFTTLQPALDTAEVGDQIWVAKGIYTPTNEISPGDPRSATFQLQNGVAIYGGFDPTADDIGWSDRDWRVNITILSGDLNGDDEPGFVNIDENSYHVFYHPSGTNLESTAIMDGFTISGGNADIGQGGGYGGGMYNYFSSPTLTNCSFSNNSAEGGGGMYNVSSSPTLTNCTFSGNMATDSGGGMYNSGGTAPVLTNCTFSGNTAVYRGGAIFNSSSALALSNCNFEGNSADYGGGMFNLWSSPTVTGCGFYGNSAMQGGGMYNDWDSSPQVRSSTFRGNSASNAGGGMFNDDSSPVVSNCAFLGNETITAGGGMYNSQSSPVVTNCTFSCNSAYAIFNYESSPTVSNCILWGDGPGEISTWYDQAVVTYSNIQGGHSGEGNIDLDPLFVDPDSGDYHLTPNSPCIDSGTNDAPNLPDFDFEGDPRIMDSNRDGMSIVEMGIDEVFGFAFYLPLIFTGH